MILVLSIWSVAIVAFVSGVAVLACRRIRRHESLIRAPLRQQLEQQQETLQKVQSARATRDFFLASLSHELRTPLSGIQGAVQLLRKSGLKGPQQEYVDMISYASTALLEIVDDMLTYSRMQAGSIPIECVGFNVRQMIDDMLALQSIKAQDRGIVLISDVCADVPTRLRGDRGKLNQILLNLIGNAIKFTDEGSVTVSVCVVQSQDADGTDVRLGFVIRDTGIGMSEHELSQIFEPFVQGHAARLGGRQGTGLGLTICRRLILAMGGNIQVDSVLGEGTSVVFQLSLACVDKAALITPDEEARLPRRSLVVLVVEDDDINRLVCTRYLALAGHHPVAVADERQMQHVMTFSGHVPNVVLMDVNLAGYSGIDLVARMRTREDGRWQNVPVIAMSADNSGTAREQARAGDIPVFLAKPFTASQLYEALGSAVQASEQQGAVCDSELARSMDGRAVQVGTTDTGYGEAPAVSARFTAKNDGTPALSDQALLDEAWLRDETNILGVDVMFELLNLFRSSAAKTFKALADAAGRQDWQAAADLLHNFQGSSANLGMQYLVQQARTLQDNIRVEGGPHPAYLDAQITRLEAASHVSADHVRTWLLKLGVKDVALPTQGSD